MSKPFVPGGASFSSSWGCKGGAGGSSKGRGYKKGGGGEDNEDDGEELGGGGGGGGRGGARVAGSGMRFFLCVPTARTRLSSKSFRKHDLWCVLILVHVLMMMTRGGFVSALLMADANCSSVRCW